METPGDTSGLQQLIDEGRVLPESIVALVGKTEGTGFHDDWGRVLADLTLRRWTAAALGIDPGEVAARVIFVLSGRCPAPSRRHSAEVRGAGSSRDKARYEARKRGVVSVSE